MKDKEARENIRLMKEKLGWLGVDIMLLKNEMKRVREILKEKK